MPKERFPLQPLQTLREAQAERQKELLGRESREVRRAAERSRHSEQQLETERQATARLMDSERGRLKGEGLRVQELQQLHAYAEAATARVRDLEQRAERDKAAETQARRAEEQARRELAAAEARRSAVERHRGHFEHAVRRKEESTQEEASADVWLSRRKRGSV